MQELVREYLNELGKKQKKRRYFSVVTIVFAVAVVGAVIWGLSRAGIATTGEANCGIEEHQHTDACYSSVLNCGQEEGGGHQHSAECYQETSYLICGQEESEEHAHTAECYQTESALVCGQEEYEGHTHTDACYTEQLSCGQEEHQHTEECYIDKSADVEDSSKWAAAYENVEWKDAWGEDLVKAAELQLDYKESVKNYEVAEDGSHKGYTRYGQFADAPYIDWDASFVNFCMYYAGLTNSEMFPDEKETAKWYEKFVEEDGGKNIVYLTSPEGYEPEVGDIVFLRNENQETEIQMGIVSSYNKEKNEIKVIEGNSDNQVKENTYDVNDEHISEYLETSEMETAYEESEEQPDAVTDETETEIPEEKNIEVETEVDGVTITLFGPESSFEAGRNYSIQAEKVEDEEVLATVEEAVEQLAEEQEKKVESYQPYDIKLLADGEEVQPLGPVAVKFSGQEVVESVEDEKTEVSVIHVDESTGEATDMSAVATDDKDVVIETEHFSVYVYVNLTDVDIYGRINVTVEHWGENIIKIVGSADASKGEDTVYTPGSSTINTAQVTTEIYSSDTISIPNEYYADVTGLSKICNVKDDVNYTATKVRVTNVAANEGKKDWQPGTYKEYNLSSTGIIEDLREGSIIRFLYTPKTANNTNKTNAVFYDYDISDGYFYNSSGKDKNLDSTKDRNYLKTADQGVNSANNFTGSGGKLAVGQHASGNRCSWVETSTLGNTGLFLNKTNGKYDNGRPKIIEGIVGDTLNADGTLKFNVQVPKSLFADGTGTTVYDGYKLGFKQSGDTYTLQYVNDGSNKRTGDLTTLGDYSGAYSNLFWPLDGLNRKPGDPDLGAVREQYHYCEGGTHAANDDGNNSTSAGGYKEIENNKANHNWHFGMTYAIEFEVGDYTGPMEFYFRGDDDLWLFIDGVKAVDIGGIHLAVGESIDLRDWMQRKGMLDDKTKKHTFKVFYMERGGFGSCCYMQFILPKAVPITVPTMKTTEYEINKIWDDNDNPYRPTQVEITLVQKFINEKGKEESKPTSEKIILPKEDGSWTHTWKGLPSVNGKTQGKYDYTYTAKEMYFPQGYESAIDPKDPNKLVNTLSPVSVQVAKNWVNDSGESDKYRPDSVTLRLFSSIDGGEKWEPFMDTKNSQDGKEKTYRDVTLTAANGWKETIDDLPGYCNYELNEETGLYTAKKVYYCVRELDANDQPLDEGGQLEGKQLEGNKKAMYKVSYSEGVPAIGADNEPSNPTLTATNTLLTKFKMVKRGTDGKTDNLVGAKFILTPKRETEKSFKLKSEGDTDNESPTHPTYDGLSTSDGIEWTAREPFSGSEIIPGTYIMQEVEAPTGYTVSEEEWIVQVTRVENETGSTLKAVITVNDEDATSVDPIDIYNDTDGELVFVYGFIDKSLYELPSTGGSGIYWYMFSGVLLMSAATLMAYRKKRRGVLRS